MDKTLAKKTAIIASAAKASGGMFVFATLDSNLLAAENASAVISKFKYLEHSCTDCGTHFAAPEVAGMQYHCNTCGSPRVETSQVEAKPIIANDESLSLVNCSSCGTHNVLPKGVVASTNQLNCTACGHTMNYKAQASAEKADLDDFDLDGDASDMDSDDLDIIDIEDDGDSLFDDDSVDNPVVAADDGQDIPSKEDGENTNEIPSDKPLDMDSAVTPAVSKGFDQGKDPSETPPATVDLLSEFDSKKDSDLSAEGTQLSFVYIGKNMAIASGMTIIATLTPEQAGDNAEMMHTAAFQTAVAHTIKTQGVKKAAQAYGFEGATIQVNLGAEATKRVTAAVAADKKAVTAKIAEVAADFQQALDIAAAGFAANFWRNHHDPVKAALIAELTNLGHKSAPKMVDRIFASHGVAQVREILEIARELAEKPVEARNGLAQAINLSKYLPTQVQADADEFESNDDADEDDMDEEEATVASIAIAADPVTASHHNQSETAHSYKTPELRAIMGGKSLFQ